MFKISFIIAAYNIEDYIERCLNSILIDERDDFEVLVVNDGSTDNTLNIINKYAEKDKRVKVITQDNKGLLEARKTGFINAKGEYILFIDGDDWIDNKLKDNCYRYAKDNELDILLFNAYLAYDDGRNIVYEKTEAKSLEGIPFSELILKDKINHNVWNKLIRREFIPKDSFMKLPSITMGEDFLITGLLTTKKPKIKIIDEAYYYYYVRNNSVTKTSSKRLLEIIQVLDYLDKNILSRIENSKELSDFLWFKYSYYLRVITSRYKRSEVEKEFYNTWKSKGIDISKNKYCNDYVGKQGVIDRILLKTFNISYNLGAISINSLIWIKRIIKR